MKSQDKNFTYEVNKSEDGKYTIEVKVSPSLLKTEKEKIFNKLKDTVTIKGFRPGKAPRLAIETKLGPKLYEETVNALIPKVTQDIVDKENLTILARPVYSLKKMSDDDGLEYSVEIIAIAPFSLPDFTKIKVAKDKVVVSQKEIEDVLEDMFNNQKNADKSKKATDVKSKKKVTTKSKSQKQKSQITDEWVKSLKIPTINSVEKLKDFIKKQLEHRKGHEVEDKYTEDIIKEIIKNTDIKLPETILQNIVTKREEDYKKKITDLGLKLEDFLKARKTTLDKLRKEWLNEEEERAKKEFIFLEIAKKNNIRVSAEEINKELDGIKDEKLKKQYSTEHGRNVIASILIQAKVINWIKQQMEK